MTPHRQNWYAEIAVAVLIVALVVLSIFLVRQYRIAARQGTIAAARIHFADITRHRELGASDADLIAPWMTFDYISVSFKVPIAYLASALDIASSTAGYPNITLGRYAKSIATSSQALTAEIQGAVKDYLSSPADPQEE